MADPFNPQAPKLPEQGLVQELQAEVSTETAPLLMFILNNARLLVGAVCLLVAVILGTGVWNWHAGNQLEDAQAAFGRVLINTEGEARITALQDLLPKTPKSIRISVLLQLGETAITMKQYDVAASAYAGIVALDADGTIGIMAALNQIDVLLRVDKPTEALALLELLAPKAPELLKSMVQENIAAVAEEAGNLDRALLAYEELLKMENLLGDTGYFETRIKAIRAQQTTKS